MDGTIRVRTAAWFATAVVVSVFATLLVMQEWRADAAPGDSDATWVAVEPCRLFDYRPGKEPLGGKKTPLVAGAPATQQVTGNIGNCSIPTTGVVAVSMNVTIVSPTAQSNLRLYPADAAKEPVVSNLNWLAGDSPTPNKVDVKLSSTGAVELAVANGTVNVLGDIVGYYTNTSLKELAAGLAAADAKIAALEIAQPFAVTNTSRTFTFLTTTPTSYLDVQVAAQVAGNVTINYSTYTDNSLDGSDHRCAVYLSTEIPSISIDEGTPGMSFWETAGLSNQGSLSGTVQFPIGAGETTTYSLACEQIEGVGTVAGRSITAIFTPAP
jgi:hypothetical protein